MDTDSSVTSKTSSRAPGSSSSSSSSSDGGGGRQPPTGTADKDPASYHHSGKSGWEGGGGGGGDGTEIWGMQHPAGESKLSECWTLSDADSVEEDQMDPPTGEGLDRELGANICNPSSSMDPGSGRHNTVGSDWGESLSCGSDRDTRHPVTVARCKTFPRDMSRMDEDKVGVGRHASESDTVRDFASSSTHSLRESMEGRTGCEGTAGGGWRLHQSRGSVGSTSSVNSVGSSSSWRSGRAGSNGAGNGGGVLYQRATSPRKGSNHGGPPFMAGGVGGKLGGRYNGKSKKPMLDLHISETIHNEPSGWGELPSPRSASLDTGTEVWGIPEDVKKRMAQGRLRENMETNTGGVCVCVCVCVCV